MRRSAKRTVLKAQRAVIFDLDGVLVDSAPFHLEAWRQWARETHVQRPLTRAWFHQTFGLRNDAIFATLFPRPLTPEEVRAHSARKETLFRKLAQGKLRPLPGARELVKALHQVGFRLAVGTSTSSENLELILEELELSPYFATRVSGLDVQQGKPDPEVFLRAAQLLKVPIRECVVIEDSEAGVEAARRRSRAGSGGWGQGSFSALRISIRDHCSRISFLPS